MSSSVTATAPAWFANATCSMTYTSATGFKYCWVEYLGIQFRVNETKTKFNAEDIIKGFNARIDHKTGKTVHSKSFNKFIESQDGNELMTVFGDEIECVRLSKTANGHYMPWIVFDGVLHHSTSIMNTIRFTRGEELNLSTPGILYMVQPEYSPKGSGLETCLESDIYKYGRTWNMDQRLIDYGNDTYVCRTVYVSDMKVGEAILLEVVKRESITQSPVYGDEYYEMEGEDEAHRAFEMAMEEIRSKGITVEERPEHKTRK